MKDTHVVKERLGAMFDQFAEAITKYLMEKYGLVDEDHPAPSAS
jgi:hypothetical protein